MQIEDVSRIGFAARWAAQQQRHLAVRLSVLGQIVVNDQHVLAGVHQLFGHGATGKGSQPAKRRRFRRTHRHDRRVRHRALLLEDLRERGDRRVFLAYRDVNAKDVAAFLVDDRVDRHRRFSGRPVADDQLALTLADRNQRVDRADAGLQRLFDGLPLHDARRDVFDGAEAVGLDRAFAIDWLTQRVDNAAQERLADRNRGNPPGAAHAIALFDLDVRAHDHDADVILFEVQRDALQAVGELDQLRGTYAAQSIDAGQIGSDLDDRADLVLLDPGLELRDLLL